MSAGCACFSRLLLPPRKLVALYSYHFYLLPLPHTHTYIHPSTPPPLHSPRRASWSVGASHSCLPPCSSRCSLSAHIGGGSPSSTSRLIRTKKVARGRRVKGCKESLTDAPSSSPSLFPRHLTIALSPAPNRASHVRHCSPHHRRAPRTASLSSVHPLACFATAAAVTRVPPS